MKDTIETPTGRVVVYPAPDRTGGKMTVARVVKRDFRFREGCRQEFIERLIPVDELPADLAALCRIIAEAQAILDAKLPKKP